MSSNKDTTDAPTTRSTSLSHRQNTPTLEQHMQHELKQGDVLPALSRELDVLAQKYDVTIDDDVKASVAYALEQHNVPADQVPALMKHFLMSPELRDCIKYNRRPTPRDFLDVYQREGPRTR